jgi:hypothetical protein
VRRESGAGREGSYRLCAILNTNRDARGIVEPEKLQVVTGVGEDNLKVDVGLIAVGAGLLARCPLVSVHNNSWKPESLAQSSSKLGRGVLPAGGIRMHESGAGPKGMERQVLLIS